LTLKECVYRGSLRPGGPGMHSRGLYLFSEVFDLKPTSGLSLQNSAHLSNFWRPRTVSAAYLLNRRRSRPRILWMRESRRLPTTLKDRGRRRGRLALHGAKHIRGEGAWGDPGSTRPACVVADIIAGDQFHRNQNGLLFRFLPLEDIVTGFDSFLGH